MSKTFDLTLLNQALEQESNQFRSARLLKLQQLVAEGLNPYPSHFKKSHEIGQVIETYSYLENNQEVSDVVTVAGRLYSIRNSGMFMDLRDSYHKCKVC